MKSDASFVAAVFVLFVFVAFFFGFVPDTQPDEPMEFKNVERFGSYDELAKAFEDAQRGGYYMGDMMFGLAGGTLMRETAMAEDSAAAPKSTGDYSETNVQVEGVDEADIVKTDGKYIYNFSENKLVITDAYPIEGSKVVSITRLENVYPSEMFVEGDKLMLFGREYNNYGTENTLKESYYYGGGGTIIQVYDISDRSSPKLDEEIRFEGSYLTSRLIGSNAYFVINSWSDYYWYYEDNPQDEDMIPKMMIDGEWERIAEPTEIGFIPPMPAESFVTLVSLNLETQKMKKETIAGSAGSVFASQDAIYIASTVWLPKEPILTKDVPIVEDIEKLIVGGNETTVINKFGLDNGKIGFLGQGEVLGHVLNQFSMDEYDGYFRVATTLRDNWMTGEDRSSAIYVLDSEMETVGKITGIAPKEDIYSARFMGKKAYLVTFRKTDPFFVIDLENPREPKILGKLKIPGYSDYLHPIDETHIIGIGKDTIESAYGDFAWYQGIKMAIFDVSDVSNPIEMHKIIIGDRGTDSYALSNHKAFLYDKEKDLLVIPVMLAEIPESEKKPGGEENISPSYGEYVFQGALVFRVTLENGFEERGRITHITDEEELKRGYYYGEEYTVKRALYIGDVLYTLSDKMLKANYLHNLQEIKDFVFKSDDEVWFSVEPIQCMGNQWEQWQYGDCLDVDSDMGCEQVPEKMVIEDWLAYEYGVTVKDYKREFVYEVVCEACSCPRGDKISVLVGPEDIDTMENEVNWTRE